MIIENPDGTFGFRPLVTSRGTSNATLDNKENQGESSGKQPKQEPATTPAGQRATPAGPHKDKGWDREGHSQR